MADADLIVIEDAAAKLRGLAEEVVFVGGATLGLLITDTGVTPIRATIDVDVIAEITSYMDYIVFSEKLRQIGFTEDDRPGAPTCRWLHGELILDVMPTDKSVLGFSNRWYKDALRTAQLKTLPNGKPIRVITAPYFLGTKIEAFRGRGNRDYWASRDLEDCIAVIDGRESVLAEIASSAADLRMYLAEGMRQLLTEANFVDALPGYLLPDEGSQQRLPGLLHRLRAISEG